MINDFNHYHLLKVYSLPWIRSVMPARGKVSKEYIRGVFDCSKNTAYSFIDMFRLSNIGDSISLKKIVTVEDYD